MIAGPGSRDALAQGPQLASPSVGQRRPRNDRKPILSITIGRSALRNVCGAVAAVVVDHDDRPGPRIVLTEQRGEALADDIALVTRRNDDGDGRPNRGQRRNAVVARGATPEPAPAQSRIAPYRQRKKRRDFKDHLVVNYV